ncbi:FecR domain-containing protein [Parabacteroides acidifaciens]|uniref:DUF4974 domain-containing protein n=1 Tax=Parabacteroides acidifaciens TaxID=2290935 RepID=A0A3D8HHL4_9BACT|nr:FecR domain-containing protein [Parabacteroides acidifaciens]MBC8600736.1 FecR domain-containing protein [Parabacteroides acidifaciens]RDU50466.1 DUF4974 domain-containing protein [Parabacteroides acidifaciens]
MENKINHIIARVLSGESTSEDILSLSEWLNDNENNREEFRRLKNYWDADVAFKQSVTPAFSAEKLLQQIKVQDRHNRKRQSWRSYAPLIAAVTLLFIFSTAFLFYYTNNHVSEYYTLLTDEHKSNFTLEDGTVITLNKNSRLSYSDKYGKNKRDVKLEGEAYFEVAKNPEKPFQVEMNGASIIVLGTHFNVKADSDSDDITATLVEGSIRFEGAKQNIVMTPNQQLTFSRSTNKVGIKHVDTDTFTSWKDGLLKYKSIPFIELIEELKNTYKVDIEIDNEELKKPTVTVSGTFSKEQSIEQILKVISRSLPIRWSNSNGVYYIQYVTLKKR